MDEVFIKTNPSIFTYKYQLCKIFIHTAIAYKVSKYITKKLLDKRYFKSVKPIYLFLAFLYYVILISFLNSFQEQLPLEFQITKQENRLGINLLKQISQEQDMKGMN